MAFKKTHMYTIFLLQKKILLCPHIDRKTRIFFKKWGCPKIVLWTVVV
jgi:hypothetical protein